MEADDDSGKVAIGGAVSEVDPDQQLGDGDGGDRCVVAIGDQLVEGRSGAADPRLTTAAAPEEVRRRAPA